eukprot:SAG22_NODE_6189_length_888_cov_0.883397_1_plen_144_part_01
MPESWAHLGEITPGWHHCEGLARRVSKIWGAMRDRDTEENSGGQFADEIEMEWLWRLVYLQVSDGADCTRAEVLAALPEPAYLAKRALTAGAALMHSLTAVSPYVVFALWCESIGEDQLCLAWATTQLELRNDQGAAAAVATHP